MLELTGSQAGGGSFTKAAAMDVLNDAQGVGLALAGFDLRLYKAGPTPNSAMVFTDFTEADFGGYAAVDTVVFAPVAWDDGVAQITSVSPAPVFTAANSTTPNTVLGWMLTKGASPNIVVHYAEPFQAPKEMTQAGHQIICPPTITLRV